MTLPFYAPNDGSQILVSWIDEEVCPYLEYDLVNTVLSAVQYEELLVLDSFPFPRRFGLQPTLSSLFCIKTPSFSHPLSIPSLPSPVYCSGLGAEWMTSVSAFILPHICSPS